MNIPEFDFTAQDPLAYKVIMHLDVLHVSMEYEVLGVGDKGRQCRSKSNTL